jgi:hypothetical protein
LSSQAFLSDSSSATSFALPVVLLGLGAWFFVHLLRRVPQLHIMGPGGAMSFRLGKGTSHLDMATLRSKLEELGYPVDPTDG